MPHTSFITDGYEQIEKTVKPFGDNGAHVGAPKDWIGKRVVIIKLDE
jgi:putative transposon-encoded protein